MIDGGGVHGGHRYRGTSDPTDFKCDENAGIWEVQTCMHGHQFVYNLRELVSKNVQKGANMSNVLRMLDPHLSCVAITVSI